MNRRLTDAAEIACKEQQDFYLGHDGGYVIPIHSKNGQGMRIRVEKLLNEYGKNDLIPVYLQDNTFKVYLNREVKSAETNNVETSMAEQCARKSNDISEPRFSTHWW